MKMKTYEIEGLLKFLIELELVGKESRMRSRFCKFLTAKLEQVEQERMELINQFSEKDENGEPQMTVDNDTGTTSYKITDVHEFNNEFQILMNEEFIVEETEDKKEMFEVVKNAALNTNKVYSGTDAVLYDRWCDIIEGE